MAELGKISKIKNRIWVFRILGLVPIGLMILSFSQRWWTCDIQQYGLNCVSVRPYGLVHNLGNFIMYVDELLPPKWLTYAAFIFILVAVAALIYSLFAKLSVGKLIMRGVGGAYIGYIAIVTIYALVSFEKIGINPVGYRFLEAGEFVPFETGVIGRILPGYYIALVAALLCVALASFRERLTGEERMC